jgi:NAD(P)-dependent dehydrogenase (short-subunit alcohol dehydrogenase family)
MKDDSPPRCGDFSCEKEEGPMGKFSGQVVIVTGAAQGIGRAVAEGYARAGAKVVMADLNRDLLLKAASRLQSLNGEVIAVPADVRKEEEIVRLVQKAVDAFGTVHILINNAGVSRWKSPYDLTAEEWDDVIDTNLRSVFLCSREAAKVMRTQKSGVIINLASTRALMSEPNTEAYAASKAGIVGLTHALAISLGPDGIRVNAIAPGWVETGDYGALRAVDHEQHPAGRVGKPEDIVKACFYLSDPENDFVTGIQLVVDGGMTRKMIYEE